MRAVVITGTSTGIGRACALTLDRMGLQVFAGVRRPEDGDALRAEGSDRLTPILLDVTDDASIRAARDLVELRVRDAGLTGLVNNAGTTVPCPVEYLPLEVFRHQLEVNLTGHLAITQAFLPLLRRARGRIVNVSSVAAIGTALPGNAFYAATKAEVVILTRRFAMELGPHGITVNAVAPGFVRTDMTQGGRGAADWQGTEERLGARAMMGRIGEPEDIANAVMFLVSPESGWITAQMLTVDGGRMDYIGHG